MTQRRSPLLRPGLQDSLSLQGTLRKGFEKVVSLKTCSHPTSLYSA